LRPCLPRFWAVACAALDLAQAAASQALPLVCGSACPAPGPRVVETGHWNQVAPKPFPAQISPPALPPASPPGPDAVRPLTRIEARMPSCSAIDTPERAAAHSAGLRYVGDSVPGIRRGPSGRGFRYLRPDGKPVRDTATLQRIR